MSAYRVSVFKTLLSSDGHPFKCLQFSIDIERAKSSQRAIEAARRRYQRRGRLPDWMGIADIVEAKDMEPRGSIRLRAERRSISEQPLAPSPKPTRMPNRHTRCQTNHQSP